MINKNLHWLQFMVQQMYCTPLQDEIHPWLRTTLCTRSMNGRACPKRKAFDFCGVYVKLIKCQKV